MSALDRRQQTKNSISGATTAGQKQRMDVDVDAPTGRREGGTLQKKRNATSGAQRGAVMMDRTPEGRQQPRRRSTSPSVGLW